MTPVASAMTSSAVPDRSSAESRDYQVYGITFRSEIPLTYPEQPATTAAADVTLSLAAPDVFERAIAGLSRNPSNGDWYEHVSCPDGSDFVRWPALFEFLVSPDGRSIACRPLERSTHESFQTYLLGHVLSFALVKQGYEPLHATVVVIDGAAVAFLGASGQGKSTLAAAFLYAGHQVLTDDLLLIRRVAGALCGFPGPPRLKLFPDVARRFLPDLAPLAPMNPESEKLVIALERPYAHSKPAPLRAFVVLDGCEGGHLDISPVNGAKAWLALLGATFNRRLVGPVRLRRQFVAAREWSTEIPVKRVTYDWTVEALGGVCQTVTADLRAAASVPA